MMKIFASFCAAIAVAVVATYLVVANQKAAQNRRDQELMRSGWEAERAALEAALKAAKHPSAVGTVSAAPAEGSRFSATEVLEKLKKMKVAGGDQRNMSIRHIVHQLETLVDLGSEALPTIKEFLGKFEDVDYSTEARFDEREPAREETKERPTASVSFQNVPRLDGLLPPSLRLGLVQVLHEIGGDQAEVLLGDMLTTSGRGVEVAYVARVLQEMAPNKYRDVAIAAAKDLLANPPAMDRPNRLDENAKNFLYGVLSMYSDQSFANTAQTLLVTPDGKVDRTALAYLTGTLKDESVPALYQAFKDSRVTNLWERASLATQILSYTGTSQQANDVFKELVANDSLPAWLRATAIQTVAGGRGPMAGGAGLTDPAQIRARLDLLNSLPDFSEDALARARVDAIQRLNLALGVEGDDAAAAGKSFRTRLDKAEVPAGLQGGK
jgi:hypothetical protein